MFESRRDEERITSRRSPAKRTASIVARTLSARTDLTPSPRVPIAESTSLPGSSVGKALACIGLPTTIRSNYDLPPKAERPNAVISCPRAKPWLISALAVLPVPPSTNSRMGTDYTFPAYTPCGNYTRDERHPLGVKSLTGQVPSRDSSVEMPLSRQVDMTRNLQQKSPRTPFRATSGPTRDLPYCKWEETRRPEPRTIRDGRDTWLATSSPEPQSPEARVDS